MIRCKNFGEPRRKCGFVVLKILRCLSFTEQLELFPEPDNVSFLVFFEIGLGRALNATIVVPPYFPSTKVFTVRVSITSSV
jgi:hypothetical protein